MGGGEGGIIIKLESHGGVVLELEFYSGLPVMGRGDRGYSMGISSFELRVMGYDMRRIYGYDHDARDDVR